MRFSLKNFKHVENETKHDFLSKVHIILSEPRQTHFHINPHHTSFQFLLPCNLVKHGHFCHYTRSVYTTCVVFFTFNCMSLSYTGNYMFSHYRAPFPHAYIICSFVYFALLFGIFVIYYYAHSFHTTYVAFFIYSECMSLPFTDLGVLASLKLSRI